MQTIEVLQEQAAKAAFVKPDISRSYEAQPVNPQGFKECFELWYKIVGCNLPLQDWEKMTFKKIVSSVGKYAANPNNFIDSGNVVYMEKIK